MPASLATNQNLAAAPVDILQAHRSDLTAPQAQPHEQQQDRVIATTHASVPIATAEQPAHCCRL